MYRSIVVLLLTALVVSLSACGGVSKSEYEAVVAERDALENDLTLLEEEVASLEKECLALEAENVSLKDDLSEQKQKVAGLIATAAKRAEAEKKAKADAGVYVVKSGDTLTSLARKFKVSVATLQELNDLKDSNIRIGQKLRLR